MGVGGGAEHDHPRPGGARHLQGQQADRAGSGHHRKVAGAELRRIQHAMDHAGQRLDQRAARGSPNFGEGWTFRAGTTNSEVKPPFTAEPIERRLGQRLTRPSRQKRQTPQVEK